MSRPIRDKNGKFAGSVGDGKDKVPEPAVRPMAVSMLETDLSPQARYAEQLAAFQAQEASASTQVYVAEAEARLMNAEARLADADARYAAMVAEHEANPVTAVAEEAAEHQRRAQQETELSESTKQAVRDCRPVIERLYTEAGVPERYARFYAGDVISRALEGRRENRRRREWWSQPGGVPVLEERRQFATATAAAREASGSDTEFQEACSVVRERLAAYDEFRAQPPVPHDEAAHAEHITRARNRYRAVQEREQAAKDVQAATVAVAEAYARRDAGVPGTAVRVGLDEPAMKDAPTISRNPDGSTNVWVWRPASAEHPNGEYVSVVGVKTVGQQFGGRANMLVTADGESVCRVEHYFRGPGNGFNQRPVVVIAQPLPGATPLDVEGEKGGRYGYFVDTTD